MAEQFITLMADLDDKSQGRMAELYRKLQEKGFTGIQTPGLPFHISHIGVFPGGKVLFGAPDMNPGLLSLHEACLMKDRLQEYDWTPHATIIIDEPEIIGEALPIIGKSFEPFHGEIVRLHLCAFWPTREILSVSLL